VKPVVKQKKAGRASITRPAAAADYSVAACLFAAAWRYASSTTCRSWERLAESPWMNDHDRLSPLLFV